MDIRGFGSQSHKRARGSDMPRVFPIPGSTGLHHAFVTLRKLENSLRSSVAACAGLLRRQARVRDRPLRENKRFFPRVFRGAFRPGLRFAREECRPEEALNGGPM